MKQHKQESALIDCTDEQRRTDAIYEMNAACEEAFGFDMAHALDDECGCFVNRHTWMSPRSIALSMISLVNALYELDPELSEQDFPLEDEEDLEFVEGD